MQDSAHVIEFRPSNLTITDIDAMMATEGSYDLEIGMAQNHVCAFGPGSTLRSAAGDWWSAQRIWHDRPPQISASS